MKKQVLALIGVTLAFTAVYSQDFGLNFNHNPENIDFSYVDSIGTQWIRATPRILDYADGKLDPENDAAIEQLVEAGKKGYKIAFGFRWDFAARKMAVPASGSKREADYFRTVDKIMERLGAYVTIFKLGNEPNLETIESDLHYDNNHEVPLLRFTQQLLERIKAFYALHPDWTLPQLYVGSFPALFEERHQEKPGVQELIRFAQESPDITGLAIHLHIADTLQIEEVFRYVRAMMPEKPIIVPEFSLFRLYNKHLGDTVANSTAGQAFVRRHQLPPHITICEWLSLAHAGKAPYAAWEELFLSQEWYPAHYLRTFYRYFERYRVVLATYPLVQQGFAQTVTSRSPSWFLNPLFLNKSFPVDNGGRYYKNPLSYPDFMELLSTSSSL